MHKVRAFGSSPIEKKWWYSTAAMWGPGVYSQECSCHNQPPNTNIGRLDLDLALTPDQQLQSI